MMAPGRPVLEDEVQLTYFAKGKNVKNPRIGTAKLLDISNAGLCMEIPMTGSELYMESGGKLFLLNKNIEVQIFCRSHPNNISLDGQVKWIQRESRPGLAEEEGGVFVGVLFSFSDADQRKYLAQFVEQFRNDTVRCRGCGTSISVNVAFCYKCGAKHVRKRTFLRSIIAGILSSDKDAGKK